MASKTFDQSAFWHQHTGKFLASGLSRNAYCREHGLKIHQLTYQLARRGKGVVASSGAFAQVSAVDVPPVSARSGCARLLIGGTAALEFDTGVDPAWVARLVQAVGVRA